MSLISNGRETALVYPDTPQTDWRGNQVTRPSTSGTKVKCRMQPVRTRVEERQERVRRRWTMITTLDAPIGPWSAVEWDGRTLDVVHQPARFNESLATAHVAATLQER